MNEQEMFINEKIKKREKTDIILAYILIVILLGAILIVLYLKFIRKNNENITNPEEYIPTYISLNELSRSLNRSAFVTSLASNNVVLTSSVNDNNLNINYSKENNNINLIIPLVGSELQIEYSEENKDIAEDIIKELAAIICIYNKNEEDACRTTINSININNQIEGIRILQNENTTTTYIDIMKKIDVTKKITYNEVTISEISNTNYTLLLQNTEINNIKINNTDTNIIFTGNIKSLNNDNILKVLIKLYDNNNNLQNEKYYEYTENKPLNNESVFEINFELNNDLKLENISKYSIEIIK